MQVAQAAEDFIVKEKKKAEEAYRQKVTTLFRQVDTSGDGKIDIHEFKRLLKALQTCWDSANRMQWCAVALVRGRVVVPTSKPTFPTGESRSPTLVAISLDSPYIFTLTFLVFRFFFVWGRSFSQIREDFASLPKTFRGGEIIFTNKEKLQCCQ